MAVSPRRQQLAEFRKHNCSKRFYEQQAKSNAASIGTSRRHQRLTHCKYSNLTHLPQQLRQEILQIVANHDPKLALDFLRASRPASSEQRSYAQPAFEAQLEMRLAEQLAAK